MVPVPGQGGLVVIIAVYADVDMRCAGVGAAMYHPAFPSGAMSLYLTVLPWLPALPTHECVAAPSFFHVPVQMQPLYSYTRYSLGRSMHFYSPGVGVFVGLTTCGFHVLLLLWKRAISLCMIANWSVFTRDDLIAWLTGRVTCW